MAKADKCVECGGHVPIYQKFLCEDCWTTALNQKLLEEDEKESVKA
ncbi:hypothetical protein BN1002_00818 [Bacillus sp. B-jedd]|nr:hypothetical protein BN1002_00818 [Bacillus sp. B-jedd]